MQPDFDRVIRSVHHEEPDRVPLVEALVAYEIQSQFLGRTVTEDDLASQVEFWSSAGYDYIPLTAGMLAPGKVTTESHISRTLNQVGPDDLGGTVGHQAWNLGQTAWIHDEADLESFLWEKAANVDLCAFDQVQQYLRPGMKIVAMSGKIFTLTWMLMGFENFALNVSLNPDFVANVLERVGRIQLDTTVKLLSIPNVAAIWAVDDISFGTGPMINPRTLGKYLFPWYKELARQCHENGLLFFFHSDGLLWDLLDDLLDLPIDALHPIDPTCMDIEEVKREIGDRCCLFGNISNELLAEGRPEEVVELTKRRLKALAPGGGYALGSGNSVPNWARFENYNAMRETALKHGRYPIQDL